MNNMLHEKNQTQKVIVLLHLYEMFKIGKSIETENRLVVSRCLGYRKTESDY